MNDDFNPDSASSLPPGDAPGSLARALEDLIQGNPLRDRETEFHPTNASNAEVIEHQVSEIHENHGHCPEPGEWALLLNGEVSAPETARVNELLVHAALCKACADRLRLLSSDVSDEETAALDRMSCASARGQRTLAAELARTSHLRLPRQASRLYLWTGAGLAASLLIAVGLTGWWRVANNPERLIAQAYTSARPFELRVPGASFAAVAPERHLRGAATGREPARLLEARVRIERQLELTPNDHHWLQLEARADLLEEKYDPAIDILDRLLAAGPVTASLLLDDATAYFQRGSATDSENDRDTALDELRKADELAPSDPVILFNEAIAMEDRGQLMNAVEVWNRYLRFERDPRWQADGRRRLDILEQKLDQLKSHQSRMQKLLSTPQSMRTLAEDRTALAALDEELSTTLLPGLLDRAFPQALNQQAALESTPDRSRGSPCGDDCQSARTLLYALAACLLRNHHDSWLADLLPPNSPLTDSSPSNLQFTNAAHALAQAISAYTRGDYLGAADQAIVADRQFNALRNPAGQQRAMIERADALQAMANYAECYGVAHGLLLTPTIRQDAAYAWIQVEARALDSYCDPSPGSDAENNPAFLSAQNLAHDRHYALAELRVRNMRGGAAVDAQDAEAAWRDYLGTIREFYAGDYPALRLSATLSGLEQVEQTTPRAQLALLLQREAVKTLELTENRQLLATGRLNLATAALRAGSIPEAEEAMRAAEHEMAQSGGGKSVQSILAEVEVAMANAYLERDDAAKAAGLLDSAFTHMSSAHNSVGLRNYAVARGQLALQQRRPEEAEPTLRQAILEQERLSGSGGPASIVQAQQNRDLYAALAGIWLAEGKSGEQVLALWERYRLRVLGIPVAPCPGQTLDCLQTAVSLALARPDFGQLIGQVVLADRLLLFEASNLKIQWIEVPARQADVLSAAEALERAVNSPTSDLSTVEQTSRRVGQFLLDPLDKSGFHFAITALDTPASRLLLESDPLLGNLPWPSVATTTGDLGVQTNLEESPSLLLTPKTIHQPPPRDLSTTGKALIVGASIAAGESQLLPEVLQEARTVAGFGSDATLLVGDQANEPQVMAKLANAATLHFAGHAAQQGGNTRLLLAPDAAIGRPTALRETPAAQSPDTPWIDSDMLRRNPPRNARLVVFSACSSGKKEAGWNHGMGDIVDTLAAIGVPDIVATRWQIDSSAAVPMMTAFYGGLSHGLPVPEALTRARLTMVRDPRYRHPYYWAAWYASGSGTADLSPIFRGEK